MTGEALRHALGPPRLGMGVPRHGRAVAWLGAIALATVIGASAAIAPVAAVFGVGGAAFGLGVLASGDRSKHRFLVLLAALLVGYAFLDRGFAYLGVRPVFIGEVGLAVGVVAFLHVLPQARIGLPSAAIVMFMVWGAIRTIPYLGVYGIDAFRDGVAWEYGAFALIVGTLATWHDARTITILYGRLLPIFVVWVPIATVISLAGLVPAVPGTSVPIIGMKAGDIGVQLAGIAAFVLAGLYGTMPGRRFVPDIVAWLAWFAGAAIVSAQTRGGMLAIATAGITLVLVRPSRVWLRAMAVTLVVLIAAIGLNPTIDTGRDRVISVNQLLSNVAGVFSDTGNAELDSSRTWRLAWWDAIVAYTVDGPYFWTGKGFGINLADADGFQVGAVGDDTTLRAPHNGHLEILARAGVPGLALWILLNAVWLLAMLRALGYARRLRNAFRVGVITWLVVLWAAALVNSSFDPYLQGPQGGIWFWSVVGLGIALARQGPDPGDEDAGVPELATRDSTSRSYS